MSPISHPEYIPWVIGGIFCLLCLAFSYAHRRARGIRDEEKRTHRSLMHHTKSGAVESVRWAALIVAIIASCGILLEYKIERRTMVPVLDGLEIAAMLDNSQSMLAPVGDGDLTTSRLSVVISALENAVQSLNRDRWGLGGFSSRLNGVSPLTTDYERILHPKLEIMSDPRYIEIVGKGTNFGAAIEGCLQIFNVKKKTKKVCIILSDGEREGNEAKLQNAFAESVNKMKTTISANNLDVAFYLIGVGSPEEPYKIPTFDGAGNPIGFQVDKSGNAFMTRPDPEYLRSIAEQFHGEYIHLKPGEKLSSLLENIMNAERRRVGEKEEIARSDLSTPLIVLFITCLIVFLKCPKRFARKRKIVEQK